MAINANRRGGIISFSINGQGYDAKGDFECDYGIPDRQPIVGSDGVHGFTEKPRAPSIKGKITDRGDLDLKALFTSQSLTASVQLANGKTFVVRDAWYSGSGVSTTGEGEVDLMIHGMSAQEVS